VVAATLDPPPPRLGVTHWSARLLADHLGVSFATVARIWRRWDLRPWKAETFKFSTDPELEAKIRDVVGLYLDPPERAVVVCVDEKTQIQALDRTAPILPLRPGIPEKQTHDYRRHGITSLFAALEIATGKVIDRCYARHTNTEFLDFLKTVARAYPQVPLHVVCDNYATHKHPKVQAWLAKNPRIVLHFHPDQRVLVEHGRDLLRDYHPPGHPPRHLPRPQRSRRSNRRIHRRLERPRPPLHLDEERRPHHRPLNTAPPENNYPHATLDQLATCGRLLVSIDRPSDTQTFEPAGKTETTPSVSTHAVRFGIRARAV